MSTCVNEQTHTPISLCDERITTSWLHHDRTTFSIGGDWPGRAIPVAHYARYVVVAGWRVTVRLQRTA